MIYGLVAAVGWGLADFFGAVIGRRIGSLWTVIVAQTFTALASTAIVVVSGSHIGPVTTKIGAAVVLNGVFSATAYITHYKALQLGPVAVVSPVGATYAAVGVVLAVVVLGERPSTLALVGGVVTIIGVMLTSTDLRKLRAGTHGMPPGLPWAIVSAVGFGVGGFLLAYLSRQLGWVVGLWVSRCAQLVGFAVVGYAKRGELRGGFPVGVGLAGALGVGLADLMGVIAFSSGAEAGFISVVLVASAVFPVIAVALSVAYLGERPVPNQYAGVAMTLLGLVVLGVGAP